MDKAIRIVINESFYNNIASYSYVHEGFHSPLLPSPSAAARDARERFGVVHIETLEEARERIANTRRERIAAGLTAI